MTVIVNDQRRYPHGVPSWVDVEVPDLDAAQAFYTGLFGWTFHNAMPPDAPGAYLIAQLDGHDVAAIGPGEASVWNTYIACDDADATVRKIAGQGGRIVVEPADAGPGGRTATVADPLGAQFRLWQARRRLGAQLVNVPGSWNFSDLQTTDLERVTPFYAEVFGWVADPELRMIRVPGYGDHLAATIDPDIRVRQAFAPPDFADVVAGVTQVEDANRFIVRFTVADRDESVANAERLGATIASSSDTEWTREAVIIDPQGAKLTVSQFAPNG